MTEETRMCWANRQVLCVQEDCTDCEHSPFKEMVALDDLEELTDADRR